MRFRILPTFICLFLFFITSLSLDAQIVLTKESDTNEIFMGDPSPVTFTIEIFNPSICNVIFSLTDNLNDPSIIVNGITSSDNNHTIAGTLIEWSGVLPPNTSYFMTIETNLSNYDFFLNGGVFTNTASVDYSYECCSAILADGDPNNDALCPSSPASNCAALLADNDPNNDGDCNSLCNTILNDNIPENDYLCQTGSGGGNNFSTSSSASVFEGINVCPCDPSFSFSVDPVTNTLTAIANDSNGSIWTLNNNQVGFNPTLVLTLPVGTYNLCHETNDPCNPGVTCIECETITISCSNTPLSATAVVTDLDCNNAVSSIDLTVTGGMPAYSFAWSNGANTEDLSPIFASGDYTVTITDQCNEFLIETFSILIDTIFEPCDPSFTYTVTDLPDGSSDITMTPTDNFYVGGYFTVNTIQLGTGVSFINIPPSTDDIIICYTTYDECLSYICQECITIPPNCKYELGNELVSCADNTFCMSLLAIPALDVVSPGIIGMDYCLTYDNTLMTPTGNVFLGPVVLDGDINAEYAINIVTFPDMVCISIAYNTLSNVSAAFTGAGEVACVEFVANDDFYELDPSGMLPEADFEVIDLIESYTLDIIFECAEPGTAIADGNADPEMEGAIIYWDDSTLPLKYNVNNPAAFNATEIRALAPDCSQAIVTEPVIYPDLNGTFDYNVTASDKINIFRDIDNTTDVMDVINGMDVFTTYQVTTLNTNLIPNHYQMIAMDVNMNNSVTAGDVTHIQNRIVLDIVEFPQATQLPISFDWLFVDETTVQNDPSYIISQNYPFGDPNSDAYHRLNVPNTTFCHEINVIDDGFCLEAEDMLFHAILLGDTDGNWALGDDVLLRTGNETVDMNLSNAIIDDCQLSIPISISEMENIKALDFILEFNQQKLTFESIEYGLVDASEMGMAFNQIDNGDIYFTSFSKSFDGINNTNQVFYYATFNILSDGMDIYPSDLSFKKSYLDGISSVNNIEGNTLACSSTTDIENIGEGESVSVYPNPFEETLIIETSGFDGNIPFEFLLYDITGKIISSRTFTSDRYTFIQKDLPQGVYVYELKRADKYIRTGRLIAK